MQKYIVYLNEKSIIISRDENSTDNITNVQLAEFVSDIDLSLLFAQFIKNEQAESLVILAGGNFDHACKSFNSMFNPVKAAGGLVHTDNQSFLFIKRFERWDLPKGKLHRNEKPQAGALREVIEETGLRNLKIIRPLPSTYHIYSGHSGVTLLKETFWFEMLYEGDENPVPQVEEGITDVKWFEINEIDEPINSTYASLQFLLRSYFSGNILPE